MSRRRRSLSEDDLAIWRSVAKTATPLTKREAASAIASTHPKASDSVLPEAHAEPPKKAPIPPFRVGETPQPRYTPPIPKYSPRMDAKTHGKLTRGKLTPDRKIDLHGMTLSQAHPALVRFLTRAHGDGARLVLVVTGKGRDRPGDGPVPEGRGMLRRHVPQWLHLPPLKGIVLDNAPAHQRHGGAGALYIYLRKGG